MGFTLCQAAWDLHGRSGATILGPVKMSLSRFEHLEEATPIPLIPLREFGRKAVQPLAAEGLSK
jgi:hypothetical protein